MTNTVYNDYLDTPLGLMEIKSSSKGLLQIIFCGSQKTDIHSSDITQECITQLSQYFDKKRNWFDLPFDCKGTPFQQNVWNALGKIPFGQTLSYQDIANQLNNPKAVRAVGAANGRNPLTIVVPCHRVIGANGTLTGYAGGIERKQWLLQHEGIPFQPQLDVRPLKQVCQLRQEKTEFLL